MTLRVSPEEIVDRSTSDLLAAHPTWRRARLGDVADVLNGYAFKSALFTKNTGVPLLRIRDVGRSATEVSYEGDYDDRYLVRSGEIVVGMDGDFRVARWAGRTALLNQRVCKVTVRDLDLYDDAFLYYVLPGYLDAVHAFTSSVTVKHLSSRTVLDLPLPLPPLDEQRRIVAAIEEQFSRLDAATDSASKAALRLVTFRNTILAKLDGLPLTDDVGDVAEVRGGIQKQPKRRPVANTHPFLRVANVLRGRLDLDDVHEVELFAGELERYRLQPGDLLVVEGNGSRDQVGRSAVWRGEIEDCVHQNHLIRVRPGPRVDSNYLALYWNAPGCAERLAQIASTTSGLYTLSVSKLQRLRLAVPALDEQRRLVAEIEQQLSLIDSLRAAVDQAQKRGVALRRAILERAFRGDLVLQDPDDEPASVLLESIRAERAAAPRPTGRKRVEA